VVVAGNVARIDGGWLNVLSVGYAVGRVVYNFICINGMTGALAVTRTLVFVSGVGMILTMFVMAGNQLRTLA
jgi:uncharacterized MAPEG superfamily protein